MEIVLCWSLVKDPVAFYSWPHFSLPFARGNLCWNLVGVMIFNLLPPVIWLPFKPFLICIFTAWVVFFLAQTFRAAEALASWVLLSQIRFNCALFTFRVTLYHYSVKPADMDYNSVYMSIYPQSTVILFVSWLMVYSITHLRHLLCQLITQSFCISF